MSHLGLSRRVATIIVVAAAYYGAGKLGLSLAFVNASATAVWPPTGIALASLLILGNGVWPGVMLGAFLVNLTTAGTIATSLGIAVGNTAEGLLGVYLLRRFASGTQVFDQPQSIFKFAGLAGFCTMASASIGVACLALGGLAPRWALGPTWLTWWLGDAAGALVVAPALILWGLSPRISWGRSEWVEAILMTLALIALGIIAFNPPWTADRNFPLHFLCVPPLLWAAFRFTPREAASAILVLSGIAIWGTLHGAGPFGRYDPKESLLLLQAFMAVTSVTVLALAAGVADRRHIEVWVRQLNQGLEQRVSDATRRLRATNDELRNQISERERATLELERSETRLREAQEVARIGSWEWDIERNNVWWSEALYQIYGLDPSQFGASYEAYLERVHPEDREHANRTVQTALRDRRMFTFEHRIVRPDGQIVAIFARGRVVCNALGTPVRMMGTGLDITERKRIEEERAVLTREQIARREAEQANLFKDEFLATLSHELRNPLNAIVGWARLLREGALDAAARTRGIEAINRNADLQSQLILDLLDHSRITSGRLELQREPVRLLPIVESAIEAVKPAAQSKRIVVTARLEESEGGVWGDPDRLQQVVANLLSNAIRFTPEGGRVDVSLGRENGTAIIRVEDDGPGIAPDLLPHVFERFRRGDPSPARRHGGLGLGLTIVRHLVELHGGSVKASNLAPGRGARFEVFLPLTGALVPRGGAERISTTAVAPRPAGRSLQGLRVLLVDDHTDSREALRLLLTGRGAQVEVAGSCEQALSVFHDRPPDLLVSDIGLPGQDGHELIRQVRALPAERGGVVAAIALTAYASAEDARKAIRHGYQVHLAKPFEASELLRIVESLAPRVPSGV